MFIIDRIEHGNGGLMGYQTLDRLPLKKALKKCPRDYGIVHKEWGFWPVLCRTEDGRRPSLYWDEQNGKWERDIPETRAKQYAHELPFDREDLTTLLECVRIALYHPDMFGNIADELDLADDALIELRERLHDYAGKETP